MDSPAGRPWRLIDSGPGPGSFNLALDEALFRRVREGASPPVVRFYAWAPPAVSVGYFQEWRRDFSATECRRQGISVYRRNTGGRAVLHDDEVTYSVAAAGMPGLFGCGLLPAYRRIAAGLAAGLARLGLPAAAAPARSPAGRGRGGPVAACFARASAYEITGAGRKVVGSAQRREGDAFLQHGSILLTGHGGALAALMQGRGGGQPPAPDFPGLADLLGRRPAYAEVVRAVTAGFGQAWGAAFTPSVPTGEEVERARCLEKTRYRPLETD